MVASICRPASPGLVCVASGAAEPSRTAAAGRPRAHCERRFPPGCRDPRSKPAAAWGRTARLASGLPFLQRSSARVRTRRHIQRPPDLAKSSGWSDLKSKCSTIFGQCARSFSRSAFSSTGRTGSKKYSRRVGSDPVGLSLCDTTACPLNHARSCSIATGKPVFSARSRRYRPTGRPPDSNCGRREGNGCGSGSRAAAALARRRRAYWLRAVAWRRWSISDRACRDYNGTYASTWSSRDYCYSNGVLRLYVQFLEQIAAILTRQFYAVDSAFQDQ